MTSNRALLAIAVVTVAVATTVSVQAADRRVPNQYATIAAALAAAGPGDRVVLSPGTYREHDLDLTPGITLLGDHTSPATVVIDANGQGRVLRAESLDLPVTIVGLTITGGHAQGGNPYDTSGGGLLVCRAEVRLEDVVVEGNTAAGSGGGLRASQGRVILARCLVRGNTAGDGGGGVAVSYDSDLNALEVDIFDNTAAWGGGLSIRAGSHAVVFSSNLVGNRAVGDPGLGGAVASDLGAVPIFKSCVLADNEAGRGGAVYAADGASPSLSFVTVDRNQVTDVGGAFYCSDADLQADHTVVSFHEQAPFVLLGQSQPTFTASDVYGNSGGDWVGDLAEFRGVDGNFSADPLYCDVDDRHLQEDSPCAPENSGVGLVGAYGVGCEITTETLPVRETPLLGAQPNPFNPITEVVFTLPAAGRARVSVFDLRGRRLGVLVDEDLPAGEHRARWKAYDANGRTLASGTYLLVLETGGQRLTSKVMLVR